jgi:hypothetical protein
MEQKLANIETAIAELQRKTSQIRGILTVVGHSGKTLTMNDNLNVIELLKRVSDLEDLIHERLHSIVSTLDHSSSATAGSILKADENGLPVEAAAADVEGSHTHSKIVASDGSPDALTADASGNLTAAADVAMATDNGKAIFGAGQDMAMYYDGTNGNIDTDQADPSDLTIDCGGSGATAKTVVLEVPVWDDLNFDPTRSGGPVATRPDDVTINNVIHKEFTSANNQFCGSVAELPHPYQLNTTLYPHCHIFLKSGESAGTTGVTFTFYWELRQPSGTTSGSVTLSATSAQLNANPDIYTIFDGTGFSGAATAGGQLAVTIARTAGNAGDVVVTTYGVHHKIDTIGSRQISTK